MLPVEHNDPINAKILAISEDKIEGFVREPFEEIANRSGVTVEVVMARIAARDSPFLRLMHRLLMFFARTYSEVFSFEHPPLHDPLAVFFVACPSAFKASARQNR